MLAGVSLTPTLFSAIAAIWVGLATAGRTVPVGWCFGGDDVTGTPVCTTRHVPSARRVKCAVAALSWKPSSTRCGSDSRGRKLAVAVPWPVDTCSDPALMRAMSRTGMCR
ncbi:MAG TPA: hypothetical protein VGH27_19400 [Streptosporangiaceae bacterium]